MSQVHEILDAASGEFRGFEEKTGQGSLKLAYSSTTLLRWLMGVVGIRYLVFDH